MSSSIHYLVTFLFFIVFVIIILILTQQLLSFSVAASDTYAVDAKDVLTSAVVFGWLIIGIILIGLIFVGYLLSTNQYKNSSVNASLVYLTGESDLLVSLRILTFSFLVFGSLIVGTLAFATYDLINISNNPSQYSTIANNCYQYGKLLYLHVILLFTIQAIIYGVTYFTTKQTLTNEQKLKQSLQQPVGASLIIDSDGNFVSVDSNDPANLTNSY